MFLLQTHYDILGISTSATTAEIKAAFRRMAKLYHPDKNPNGKEQFEKILLAYEILVDADTRRRYDLKLKGYSVSSSQATKTKTSGAQKNYSFTEEELKRRNYYREHYKKEYNYYAQNKAAAENKSSYNEYKYILFATPLAVALFMLVLNGLDNPKQKENKNTVSEIVYEEIKAGSDPYTSYFTHPVFDTLANRKLVLKNTGSKDVIVVITGSGNKFIRSCVIKTGYFAELEQLPDDMKEIRFYGGKKWNGSKEFKNSKVFGGFEDSNDFYKLNLSLTNGWTISIDEKLENASEKIKAADFFKKD